MDDQTLVVELINALSQVGTAAIFIWWAYQERRINRDLVSETLKVHKLQEQRRIAEIHLEYAKMTGGKQIPGISLLDTDLGE